MRWTLRRLILCVFLLAATVLPVSAEVMDKEMSVGEIWTWGLCGAAFGLAATRWRWWCGLVSLPVAALGPLRALLEFYDQHVGPAIVKEIGAGYGAHAFGAMVMVIVAHLVGWMSRSGASKTSRRGK